MDRIEYWDWMDVMVMLAFSSAEPLYDRMFYAEWWLSLGYQLQGDLDVTTGESK